MVKLDSFAEIELSGLSDSGKLIFVYAPQVYPTVTKCVNCGDQRILHFCIAEPTGYSEIPIGGSFHFHAGKYYRVKDKRSYLCPVCNGEDARAALLDNRLNRSGLIESEYSWRIDYIKGMQGKELAYKMALDQVAFPPPRGFVLLVGGYGVGKTGLMKSLLAQLIYLGYDGAYLTTSILLSQLRATFSNGSREDEFAIMQRYSGLPYLAIDEVDVMSDTDWSQAAIRTLIDERYKRRQITLTIFATNTDPKNLWQYLGSRLDDGSIIVVKGSSLRGNG